MQLFFRNRVMDEAGYILFVRKNAIQVLIPKFGLEGTIYVADNKGKSMFTYNEEVGTALNTYNEEVGTALNTYNEEVGTAVNTYNEEAGIVHYRH